MKTTAKNLVIRYYSTHNAPAPVAGFTQYFELAEAAVIDRQLAQRPATKLRAQRISEQLSRLR